MPAEIEVAVMFTAKSIERIVSEGGTSSWRLDRNHARRCAYAVCTRNAHADWVEGSEAHHSAFLVGKISDVVTSQDRADRFLITISEYAVVDIPGVWKGDRNPVRYSTLAEVGIDPGALTWVPMPARTDDPTPKPSPAENIEGRPLTMLEAKKGLALTFGVAPESIEITIRG